MPVGRTGDRSGDLPRGFRFVRALADSFITMISLAACVAGSLLIALDGGHEVNAGEVIRQHSELLAHSILLPGLLLVPLLLAAGVYRKKPAPAARRKAAAITLSVVASYGVALLVHLFLEPASLATAAPVLAVACALNWAGCLGARTVKWLVTERFHVRRKRPALKKPVEKVLLIGGAGYIGSVLARRLLEAGYQVRVLDLLLFGKAPIAELYSHPRFELFRGDFRHVDAVIHAVRGMDAVIHLGAIVGDPACAADEETTLETNYAATALVADVCKGYGVSRFLFASTCSVYGASDEVVDEKSDLNPVSLYAATKIDSEQILLTCRGAHFHPTILRLGTAFGWSHRPRFDLVVNLLTGKAFFENKIVIYNQEQWRPFVHTRDISRAFHLMLEAPLEAVSGEIFNVGSEILNHRLEDVGATIRRLMPHVEVQRESNTDIRNYRVSFEKIRARLGFECETSLASGIREIHHQLETGQVSDYTSKVYHNHKSGEPSQASVSKSLLALRRASNRYAEQHQSQRKVIARVS